MWAWKSLTLAASGTALGFALLFAGCAIINTWWPLFVLFVYAIIPVPLFIFAQDDGFDESMNNACNWSTFTHFLEGTLITSAFGMPVVMYHLGTITGGALTLTILSPAVLLGTAIALFVIKQEQDNGDGFHDW